MALGSASYAFGFAAGALSTLSPCVLPIVPILLASAANAHSKAPLALAAGLAISFGILGTALAWAGASLGVDTTAFRGVTAAILGLIGLVLMSTRLQHRFAAATSGIGSAGNALLARVNIDGLAGQFALGLGLGIVWSPCVGPTLGAAVVLASQGSSLPQVAALMGLFGAGAALPLAALGYVSREALTKSRGGLLRAGSAGKTLLGAALVALAALILTGADKQAEAWLVDHSPGWLTQLTTRY